MVNNSRSKVTTTMSKETINETETPPPLPSTGGDNEIPEIRQTTALDNITEDVTVSNESPEQNDTLLGVMVSNDGVVNSNEEPMDVDINNEPSETLHGITMTGNVATVPLHGVTDLNSFDHSYFRQTNDSLIINLDYYTTTEDEDDAIEGLLQLSAADNTGADFPGDNSQLLPIGTRISDTTAIDINLETVAVTAAIENIALEETVSKTTNTVSTQTTFTRQRHNQPVELSDLDTDDDWSKKPIMHSQTKTIPKKAEFKTVKYEIKKRRLSRTYACKECSKCKRDLKELNKHYKRRHKPVMCGICNQLFSLPSILDKHIYVHLNKSFTCEMCGMQFSFQSQLEYHKTVHKTITSYVCVYPKCKKSFMQKGDLTLHAQIPDKFT